MKAQAPTTRQNLQLEGPKPGYADGREDHLPNALPTLRQKTTSTPPLLLRLVGLLPALLACDVAAQVQPQRSPFELEPAGARARSRKILPSELAGDSEHLARFRRMTGSPGSSSGSAGQRESHNFVSITPGLRGPKEGRCAWRR